MELKINSFNNEFMSNLLELILDSFIAGYAMASRQR